MPSSPWIYQPPLPLRNGLAMTLYSHFVTSQRWRKTLSQPEPTYRPRIFWGANQVPLFGWVAIPPQARGTWVATYGITGELADQGTLRALGTKAYHAGYAVVLFDWRAHGQSAELSATLTSDGLYEGEDFVRIAAQAIAQENCPTPVWFAGYSLGGQLALWGLHAAENQALLAEVGLAPGDVAGGVVVCPSLDSWRSLNYLMRHPLGRYIEQRIAQALKALAYRLDTAHPGVFDPEAIARADSILAFDRELVIAGLGFDTVESYYAASSPFRFLDELQTRCLIFYAVDDPLFDPSIIPDLEQAARNNPRLDLQLTSFGGHVGYLSSHKTQSASGDLDPWWAWGRALDWVEFGIPEP